MIGIIRDYFDKEKNYEIDNLNFQEFIYSVSNLDTSQNTNISAIFSYLSLPKSEEKTLVTNILDPILNAKTFICSS